MNISKDEARILAGIMYDGMDDLIRLMNTKEHSVQLATKLTKLYNKLNDFGIDKRRTGRRSMNDFRDLLKRYIKHESNVGI
jgi:hypothetical protein